LGNLIAEKLTFIDSLLGIRVAFGKFPLFFDRFDEFLLFEIRKYLLID
jgi:hypothetical protein